jgi:hypothetical protein
MPSVQGVSNRGQGKVAKGLPVQEMCEGDLERQAGSGQTWKGGRWRAVRGQEGPYEEEGPGLGT